MKHKYFAKIKYSIKESHPDYLNYVGDSKRAEFSDYYIFDDLYFPDDASRRVYMRRDLALVAGGGYSDAHISNVNFEINKIAEF